MAEDGLVEHLAVFHRAPHDLGADDRRAVVGEGDGAAFDESADLGEFLAVSALGDGADGKDVGVAGAFGLQIDELRRRLAVQRRLGVGHAGDGRDAAGQRRRRAGADRLVLLAARFAQVDVHVDQPRTDDLVGGVKGAIGLRRGMRPHAEDVLAANPQVANLIEVLSGVDDPAVADAEGNHNRLFYAIAATGTATPPDSAPPAAHATPERIAAWPAPSAVRAQPDF